MKRLLAVVLLLVSFTSTAESVDDFTKGMKKYSGYLEFYWDESKGAVFIKVTPGMEHLYVSGLASGVGSNDLGLDRGQLGAVKVVRFERTGPKVFLRQPNLDYRANSDSATEVKAVEEAFASSILWGFKVVAEQGDSVLIDATDFLLRDSHNISGRLKRNKQGSYKADKSRSAIYLPRTKNFPDNTEFEATLTMTGSGAGAHLRSVTPTSEHVTVRTHHSFIRLPDDNYQPRAFDPRVGSFPLTFKDYAVPLGEDMNKRYIHRHRLEPNKPIIYYLDPGTPEPIRSALLEGAQWWSQAFEAAGLKNAYQVKMLPDTADPMDVRYNTIQWVHRSTRGWSYGYSVSDPRTGEIIKGHVTLGSLRVRQDMLIAQGLLSPFETGEEVASEIQQMALARLRQLSAHEVGHTLGFSHNFVASTINRESVMDYPHPLVKLNDGKISLADAYDTGMGEWDKLTVEYSYKPFAKGEESEGLKRIIAKIEASGIPFITDQDSRVNSMAHPTSSLWDNGADPVAELNRLMSVRANAIQRFGAKSLKTNQPYSELERTFVPIYLLHRFQSQAAAKLVAGMDYYYAIKGGDTQSRQQQVDVKKQKAAMNALLNTLSVNSLAVPKDLLEQILPPAFGYPRNRESFKHRTSPVFDGLAVAETAAANTVRLLLDPYRAARLVQQQAIDNKQLGLYQLQTALINMTWKQQHKDSYLAEVQNAINWSTLAGLKQLAVSANSAPQVRAITLGSLRELKKWLDKNHRVNRSQKLAYQQAAQDIEKFLSTGAQKTTPEIKSMPPGSPIGMDES